MKLLAIIILLALGIFLYLRAKRLAEHELQQSRHEAERNAKQILDEAGGEPLAPPSMSQATDTPTASESEATKLDADNSRFAPPESSSSSVPTEHTSIPQSDTLSDNTAVSASNDTSQELCAVSDTNSQDDAADEVVDTVASESTSIDSEPATREPDMAQVADTESVTADLVKTQACENQAASPDADKPTLAISAMEIPDWADKSMVTVLSAYYAADDTEDAAPQDIEGAFKTLLAVIDQCYRHRKQHDYLEFGAARLPRFRQLIQAGANPLNGHGHMQLSTLLSDRGDFDNALALCDDALALGLDDGTVTGFTGRKTRIARAKNKAGG
ncbi:hypothetical protein NFHSH190041_34630 [Shewanella sp. NFH-SH190041]|uniref:hypothetical protein n=1 Tax=Shewanella sp. NFH-SH190041 TaxID=2950245 RepID=UPI0021C2E1B9|nr:hypothetical protein [Shewanella sp. NFH-SH190041]BDM66011.1 hypothetical protein NFHSH190041_34630 [Shewanella sp. NFH-SH190041]